MLGQKLLRSDVSAGFWFSVHKETDSSVDGQVRRGVRLAVGGGVGKLGSPIESEYFRYVYYKEV